MYLFEGKERTNLLGRIKYDYRGLYVEVSDIKKGVTCMCCYNNHHTVRQYRGYWLETCGVCGHVMFDEGSFRARWQDVY